MNEAQLQAIIDAAVRKAVDDTKAALAPMIAAAETKNKGLLADLKKAQGKPEPETPSEPKTVEEVMERWNNYLAERDTRQAAHDAAAKPKQAPTSALNVLPNGSLTLDREAARNPATYRAARDQAEKRGVPLVIVDANGTSSAHVGTGQSDAPRRTDFVVGRSRYVHTSVVQGQLHQLHAETARDGKRLVSFKHADQLPDDALAVYNSPEGK